MRAAWVAVALLRAAQAVAATAEPSWDVQPADLNALKAQKHYLFPGLYPDVDAGKFFRCVLLPELPPEMQCV